MATVTVSPGPVDLGLIRGDKFGPMTLSSDDGLDLSGMTWLAQIRATKDEPAEIIATFDIDTSDAATGVLRLTLPASEARNLVTVNGKGTYWWDCQATLVSDAEDVKTWFRGKISVSYDVSVTA